MSDRLYDLATWVSDDFFVDKQKEGDKAIAYGAEFNKPVAFADYNGDNQCMGYGLKSMANI